MKHYKDLNGAVFGYESDGSQDHLIKADMVEMSEAEIELHKNPPLTPEQIFGIEQSWIEAEMVAADKEVKKFDDGHTRPKGANVQVWRAYRNALRDYIQSGVIVGERPVSP